MSPPPNNKRRYIAFDPSAGYPTGPNLYYECLMCGGVVPSIPAIVMSCDCGNIEVNVADARMYVEDDKHMKLYTE
jgi:hypothetical protein